MIVILYSEDKSFMKIKKFVKLIILEGLNIFLFCIIKKKEKIGHILIITSIIYCIQRERCQKTPFGWDRYTQKHGRNSVNNQLFDVSIIFLL